ncbi:Ulp1 protease family, C-terminal catalytic domain [Sesbania bispinosa]|nr:Ulp1 protease family, C-terminal catalytic domain [Sesbania bispinosa]
MVGTSKGKSNRTPRKGSRASPRLRRHSTRSNKKQKVQEIIEISSSIRESVSKEGAGRVRVTHDHNPQDNQYIRNQMMEMKASVDGLTLFVTKLVEVIANNTPGLELKENPNGIPILIVNCPTPSTTHATKLTETNRNIGKMKSPEGMVTSSTPCLVTGNKADYEMDGDENHVRTLFSPLKDRNDQIFYINYVPFKTYIYDGRTSGVKVPSMILDDLEAAVAAYIFQPLTPDSELSYITSWFLPTTFSQYALESDKTPEIVKEYYFSKFMGTIDVLRKIYIPINDDNVHWFLLVVDLDLDQLIVLDSFPTLRKSETRRRKIKKLALFLEEILYDECFYEATATEKPIVSEYAIVEHEGSGVQDDGSNDCGVWVGQWMNESLIHHDYSELHVNTASRMRLALDLVLGDFNKIREEVIAKACKLWNDNQDLRKKKINVPC